MSIRCSPAGCICVLLFGLAIQSGSDGSGGGVVAELLVDDVGEVALERSDGVALGAAFGAASLDVGAGARVHPGLGQGHHVDRVVEAAVAALVEPVPVSLSGGGGDGRGAVHAGEAVLGLDPAYVADLADDPGGTQVAEPDQLR